MAVTTRAASVADAAPMAALLNRIIELGGTTAHARQFEPERMLRHYIAEPLLIASTVACENGEVLGFQALQWPHRQGAHTLPGGWAFIASFVKIGAQRRGVGAALWAATLAAARGTGVVTIDATIRADNAVGLAYYSGLGFADYAVLGAVPLHDGTPVDRIRKRFDLH